MIPFDISLVHVKHVHLKYITKAVGGSINVLSGKNADGKDKFTKVPVPHHVADNFIKKYALTRYLKPVITAVTYYGDKVIALERHPLGNLAQEETIGLFGVRKWISTSEKNTVGVLTNTTNTGTWYIDGTVVYRFKNAEMPENLTTDGRFQSIVVDTLKLADLGTDDLILADRVCIGYQAPTGKIVVSPPIWRDMSAVGAKKLGISNDDSDDTVVVSIANGQFDKVDKFLAVNLGFALKAAETLSDEFGYSVIEPLRLDELMIQLKTVNLQKLDSHIKKTYDIGMKFTHAVAWIIGMSDKVNTLESFRAIRSLLRYLTTRGIVHKHALRKESIYIDGRTIDDVPQKSTEGIIAEYNALLT